MAKWVKHNVDAHFPEALEKIKNNLEFFSELVENGHKSVSAVVDTAKSGLTVAQEALNTFGSFGLNPFDENPDPLEALQRILIQSIELILNSIDLPSAHYLNLFDIQNPFFNIDALEKMNKMTWPAFYNKIHYNTVEDLGDNNRPQYRDSTRVGGILLVLHSTTIKQLIDLYKKFQTLFSPKFLKPLSLLNAFDKSTNYPFFNNIVDLILNGGTVEPESQLLQIDPANPSNFAINVYAGILNKDSNLAGKAIHPTGAISNLKGVSSKTYSFLKIQISHLKPGTPFIIPDRLCLKILTVFKNEKRTIIVLLPKGEYDTAISFFVDDRGNLYRDPALAIPWNVFSGRRPEIPPDVESTPPDYKQISLKQFIPVLDNIYKTLDNAMSYFVSLPKTIADELKDIIDAFELWLSGIQNFINQLKKILDSLDKIQTILTADGFYSLYAEGDGVKGMLLQIQNADNKPLFQKGFFGGIFIVAQSEAVKPLVKLLGMEVTPEIKKIHERSNISDAYAEIKESYKLIGKSSLGNVESNISEAYAETKKSYKLIGKSSSDNVE